MASKSWQNLVRVFLLFTSFSYASAFSVTQKIQNTWKSRSTPFSQRVAGRRCQSVSSNRKSVGIRVQKSARMLIRICTVCGLLGSVMGADPCIAAAADSAAAQLPAVLSLQQLVLASTMITTVGGVAMYMRGLKGLANQILYGCARCSLQLYVLGSVILHRLLHAQHPAIIMAWIWAVSVVAARQGFTRLEYTYQDLPLHFIIAVWTGGFSVLGFALVAGLLGQLEPWFKPSTLIPVSGMLFGNTLSAAALGGNSLTREFAKSQHMLEMRLARGATSHEAVLPLINAALTAALTPTVNSLAATGLVSMPGMMTGQILAGQSPQQAAAYQTLILFLIASTACITVQTLAALVTRELMDVPQSRLKMYKLKPKDDRVEATPFPWLRDAAKGVMVSLGVANKTVYPEEQLVSLLDEVRTLEVDILPPKPNSTAAEPADDEPLVLVADGLVVSRAKAALSLTVRPGDRIGITGASGSGKTQVLRTLAGLESDGGGSVELGGNTPDKLTWPAWRQRVCWVSQDRPASETTPRLLFEEIANYASQKLYLSNNQTTTTTTTEEGEQEAPSRPKPEEIASRWHLEKSAWDRPWPLLSGGEAQRASLAIALALQPDVLLLDEVTSALDDETTALVEETLEQSKIPIVMVTHSKDQLARFCTHHLNLTP